MYQIECHELEVSPKFFWFIYEKTILGLMVRGHADEAFCDRRND